MKIPISMLASSGYCEYQIYLEKVVGVDVEDTPEIKEGVIKHDNLLEKHLLEREEEFIDVATEIEMALETGATRIVRELDVENEDLIGRIDEVQFSPHGILIIDDKPGNRAFNSYKLQVWAYCVALRDNYSPNLPLSAGLRNRDNGNMVWEKEFTAEHQQTVMNKIERLRAILEGDYLPRPAHPRKCSKCRLKQACKQNLEMEQKLEKDRGSELRAVESLKSRFIDLVQRQR